MKLISLNIWGGHEYDPLMDFLKANAETTDIFCFQEVYSFTESVISRHTRLNILEEIRKLLPDYIYFFAPIQDSIDDEGEIDILATFGQAIFLKKEFEVWRDGFNFTYLAKNTMKGKDFSTLGSGFQYIELKTNNEPVLILSIHGISRPGDKMDTPDRLIQSEKIKDFAKDFTGKIIICGDFNLLPETQSIKMLEKNMENLITEYAVGDTRGEINRKNILRIRPPQRFSDYILVSPAVKVQSFGVPNILISDHLPLILEFS